MTLNRRLLIGIAPLLIIFLAVGIYAIALFLKLGGAIDVILRENYRSVVACQNMKDAAERMDAGLLFILNGEEQRGRALLEQAVPVFDENLAAESRNITLPGNVSSRRSMTPISKRRINSLDFPTRIPPGELFILTNFCLSLRRSRTPPPASSI